jgi:hypothetical protein
MFGSEVQHVYVSRQMHLDCQAMRQDVGRASRVPSTLRFLRMKMQRSILRLLPSLLSPVVHVITVDETSIGGWRRHPWCETVGAARKLILAPCMHSKTYCVERLDRRPCVASTNEQRLRWHRSNAGVNWGFGDYKVHHMVVAWLYRYLLSVLDLAPCTSYPRLHPRSSLSSITHRLRISNTRNLFSQLLALSRSSADCTTPYVSAPPRYPPVCHFEPSRSLGARPSVQQPVSVFTTACSITTSSHPPLTLCSRNSLPVRSSHPDTRTTPLAMAEIRRKLVIVGDGACGKTCLLMYVVAHPHIANMRPVATPCSSG